jgi:DUF1680 family protein
MTDMDKDKLTRRQIIRQVAAVVSASGLADLLAPDANAAKSPNAPRQETAMSTPPNDASGSASHAAHPHHLTAVPISQVVIQDEFWSPKLKVWRDVTLDDCFTKFEHDRGGAINNFDLVRDGKTGTHAGPPWYDGLIYEMIRGAADFFAAERDPALEARIDGYIARIAAAQAKDPTGYLNTWTQMMAPQTHRWGMNGGDDREQHDVYNAGMMIEAGVHYFQATGKPALLEAATRLANLMCDTIGPPPRANVVPGHSGPEEALVKLYLLYHHSADARRSVSVPIAPERYLQLAEFFIDARGHHEGRTGKDRSFGEYGQDHAPLAQQKTLEGHAVRATLFCTGIAAAAQINHRADYLAAALRFWDSLAQHKIYISGAAGAIGDEEKFGPDYFLPNDGYMETCAAVGVGFFGHNMNLLYGEAHYIDELERALYNAVLGGTALAGNRYYYQDPLTGEGLRRWEWHGCPCCPPMFLKMTGALPGYIYAQEPGAVYVNLFIGSEATLSVNQTKVRIRQTTRYPWEGDVTLAVDPEHPAEFDLMIRIPGWSRAGSSPSDLYQAVVASPLPSRACPLASSGARKDYPSLHSVREGGPGRCGGRQVDLPGSAKCLPSAPAAKRRQGRGGTGGVGPNEEGPGVVDANRSHTLLEVPTTSAVTISVNGKAAEQEIVRGYARLRHHWQPGDVVELHLEMPVRQVKAHPAVEADHGLTAVMRGPILYCAESVDNPQGVRQLVVPPDASFTTDFQPDLLGGVTVVRGQVQSCEAEASGVRMDPAELVAIPFYASANREPCSLRVWLPATRDKAIPATLATRSRASASHCWHLDSVAAINDGIVPAKSSDTTLPRLSWWDHKGTLEWAELEFPHPAEVSRVRVFWFADRPTGGGCDLPQSWRLLYRDGNDWKPVEQASGYGILPDVFNEVTFAPVMTTALRVEVQLRSGWSAGVCEWEVG